MRVLRGITRGAGEERQSPRIGLLLFRGLAYTIPHEGSTGSISSCRLLTPSDSIGCIVGWYLLSDLPCDRDRDFRSSLLSVIVPNFVLLEFRLMDVYPSSVAVVVPNVELE